MSNKRITDVDFLDSLNSDESFFVNHNNSIKQINKRDIVFDVANGGTGATTAAAARENLGAADSETLSDLIYEFGSFVNTYNGHIDAYVKHISDFQTHLSEYDELLNKHNELAKQYDELVKEVEGLTLIVKGLAAEHQ